MASWSLPVIGVVFFLLSAIGEYYDYGWVSPITAPVSAVAVVLEIALMLSLPVSGGLNLIARWLRRQGGAQAETLSAAGRERRALLKGAAAAVPTSMVLILSLQAAKARARAIPAISLSNVLLPVDQAQHCKPSPRWPRSARRG